MNKILYTVLFLLSITKSNAALYVVIVGQNPPLLTNLCPGDTIRFSGDSLNQSVFGTISFIVENVDSTLNHLCAVTSYYNVETYCDHILDQGDVWYVWSYGDFGYFTFNCNTGIHSDEYGKSFAKIYPNPATDRIELICKAGTTSAFIYDDSGREILHSILSTEKKSIDVSSLRKGIYTIRIISESQSAMKMFVKQ